ncbi:MAG: dienelactone hydrolase family protein [Symbiobacteriaceae bacterium]|nr:dienelactone hydrolase family protein [Symbiobacteriaceae bacterium]
MWNQQNTGLYEGMLAETIMYPGYQDKPLHAYLSRPLGPGPYPSIILIPHMPGWDEWCRETARRFSHHGFVTLCPDIFDAYGHGTPTEVSQAARAAGGVPDASVLGDCQGAVHYLQSLPYGNGKVGVIGMCSGGRHAYLAACRVTGLSAAIDCWGGGVIAAPEQLTPARPVAPIDYTSDLAIPLMGIFGNDDRSPTAEQVNLHEAELKKHGKDYIFHRYDDAGHGFWYYHGESYRPKQAMDSWEKALVFFKQHLTP